MKKIFLLLVVIVAMMTVCLSVAFAVDLKDRTAIPEYESELTIDKDLTLPVHKTAKLTPTLYQIEGQLLYEWESAHPTIAKVTGNGIVIGMTEGQTTVKCTATDSSGKQYSAMCRVRVIVPIESVELEELNVMVALSNDLDYYGDMPTSPYTKYTPKLIIKPDNATNKRIDWSVEDSSVVSLTSDGTIIGKVVGTTMVYGKTMDGSDIEVKYRATVPQYFTSSSNVVIDKAEGAQWTYNFHDLAIDDENTVQSSAGIYINGQALVSDTNITSYSTKAIGDCFTTSEVSEHNGYRTINIIPVEEGKGSIVFYINGNAVNRTYITVKESAVE